jgi:hypothetical protein
VRNIYVKEVENMGKKKADKSAKSEQPSSAKPKGPTDADVLAIMAKLAENGVAEVTSRLVSDKLGFADADKGRGKVRALMKKLEADGKVVFEKKTVKEKGARKQYVYTLKER